MFVPGYNPGVSVGFRDIIWSGFTSETVRNKKEHRCDDGQWSAAQWRPVFFLSAVEEMGVFLSQPVPLSVPPFTAARKKKRNVFTNGRAVMRPSYGPHQLYLLNTRPCFLSLPSKALGISAGMGK